MLFDTEWPEFRELNRFPVVYLQSYVIERKKHIPENKNGSQQSYSLGDSTYVCLRVRYNGELKRKFGLNIARSRFLYSLLEKLTMHLRQTVKIQLFSCLVSAVCSLREHFCTYCQFSTGFTSSCKKSGHAKSKLFFGVCRKLHANPKLFV